MKALYSLAALALLAVGCSDPRQTTMDHLGIDKDPSASGSGDGITFKTRHDSWYDSETNPTASQQIEEAQYEATAGFQIQEGTAGILVMAAVFDDTTDVKGFRILQGDLHLANSNPDIAEMQLISKENRRFVVIGKKQGHVDLKVTIDDAVGEITIPVDVVPLTAVATTDP